jgi:hypothetical protein
MGTMARLFHHACISCIWRKGACEKKIVRIYLVSISGKSPFCVSAAASGQWNHSFSAVNRPISGTRMTCKQETWPARTSEVVVPPHYSLSQFGMYMHIVRSPDSAVGIATGYGLDGVRVPVGSRIFSSPRRPDRLWGRPNLLSNGGGSFPGGKAAGTWSSPLSSSYCQGQENVDVYIRSPHTPSWSSA